MTDFNSLSSAIRTRVIINKLVHWISVFCRKGRRYTSTSEIVIRALVKHEHLDCFYRQNYNAV